MMGVAVWQLPLFSQECNEAPRFRQGSEPFALDLAYDFETDNGQYAWEAITFLNVAAFRFTRSRYCTTEQIASLDELVSVEESKWLAEVYCPPRLRNYRIFLMISAATKSWLKDLFHLSAVRLEWVRAQLSPTPRGRRG